jgi:hypothetical protein
MNELEISGEAATGLEATVERLVLATAMLEQTVEQMLGRNAISASSTEAAEELERRLAAAEAEIAELRASAPVAVTTPHSRKTLPVSMVNLLAKQGVTVDSVEAGALDAALTSLSIEQRIAVKAQLMRAGILG